jgi:hypothetical protein
MVPIITSENIARKTGFSKSKINSFLNKIGIKPIFTFSGNTQDEFLKHDHPFDKHKYFKNGCFVGRLILENKRNYFKRESTRKEDFNKNFPRKPNPFIEENKEEIKNILKCFAQSGDKFYNCYGIFYDKTRDQYFNFVNNLNTLESFKKVFEMLRKRESEKNGKKVYGVSVLN